MTRETFRTDLESAVLDPKLNQLASVVYLQHKR